jgi:hypothetical protein
VKPRAFWLAKRARRAGDFLGNFPLEKNEWLAKMEHMRWVVERLLAGRRYGAPPGNEQLESNAILDPWEQLDEVNEEEDRAAVRRLGLLTPPKLERYNIHELSTQTN